MLNREHPHPFSFVLCILFHMFLIMWFYDHDYCFGYDDFCHFIFFFLYFALLLTLSLFWSAAYSVVSLIFILINCSSVRILKLVDGTIFLLLIFILNCILHPVIFYYWSLAYASLFSAVLAGISQSLSKLSLPLKFILLLLFFRLLADLYPECAPLLSLVLVWFITKDYPWCLLSLPPSFFLQHLTGCLASYHMLLDLLPQLYSLSLHTLPPLCCLPQVVPVLFI